MSSAQLLELARPLGLTEDTLDLLKVLPLVYVAWADGEMQAEELSVIVQSAEDVGVNNEASVEVLETWLTERPNDDFFIQGLKLLSYLIASLSEDDAADAIEDVSGLCNSVARAAGGLSGHSVKIDADEQMALRKVVTRLDLGGRPSSRKALQGILESVKTS